MAPFSVTNGPFGRLVQVRNVCANLAGQKKNGILNIQKSFQKTNSTVQKCMLFDTSLCKKLLLTKGKVHRKRASIFQNGLFALVSVICGTVVKKQRTQFRFFLK